MSGKAKSKKSCGLNPLCHLERTEVYQAAMKVKRGKNRTDQIVDDAEQGQDSPDDKYME